MGVRPFGSSRRRIGSVGRTLVGRRASACRRQYIGIGCIGVRHYFLSIWTAALLWGLSSAEEDDVLGFLVESFNTHMDVATDVSVIVVDVAF